MDPTRAVRNIDWSGASFVWVGLAARAACFVPFFFDDVRSLTRYVRSPLVHLQIMIPVRLRRAALLFSLSAPLFVHSATAQTQSGQPTAEMSRAQLTERARVADSLGRRQEAFLIRSRLRDGDFEVGDRMIVKFEGPGLTKDTTLVVQAGRIIRLGAPLGDIELAGALRSELPTLLSTRVDKYYKNELVHVTPLIRIGVSGAVRAPGFFHVRSDTPLSDVIMMNGAAEQSADYKNIVIKRGEQIVWANADVQSALSNGLTIEGLNIEPGDEVVIGTRTSNKWGPVLQIGLPLVSSLVLALLIRR